MENQRWGGLVIGQDKVNTARYSTARTFSANPFGFSHGQRTVRTVSRGTDQPAPFFTRRGSTNAQRRVSIRRFGKALVLIAATTIIIVICGFELRQFGFVITLTDSSCPAGIYRLAHRAIVRGELVEACLPDAVASYGIARGYLAFGSCPNDAEPVIKIVGAMTGDRVDLSPLCIRVNGVALSESAALRCDSRGRRVQTLQPGTYQTEANQVWLFGLHDARSWDSRYFGPIPSQNLVGAVDPVLTLASFARPK